MRKWIIAPTLVLLLLSACSQEGADPIPKKEEKIQENSNKEHENLPYLMESETLEIEHIHGIGYNAKNELLIATHNGLKLNRDGVWYETTANLHDYMGFQVTKDGFYVSGHPQKGSSLKNPLGLVKAVQYGEKLETINFSGESDFHFLGASYSDQDVYVINEQPNSKLEEGFYHSSDGGATFEKPKMAGFEADSYGMIGVHPSNGDVVAMATREGIYGSNDGGQNFANWADGMVTALTFSEKEMIYATVSIEGEVSLQSYSLESKEITPIEIPHLDFDNPITYIAVSQSDQNRIAFATIGLDILATKDRGANWEPLLQDGNM